AMILAKRAINSSLLVSAFQMFHHDTNWGSLNKVDRLLGPAVLASLPWDPASVRNAFERLRVELEYHGVQPEDRILAAASLADLPQSAWAEVLGRIDDLHRGRPNLNFVLASALARSPYEPVEALARFEDALAGVAARGYKGGLHIDARSSLLAARPSTRENATPPRPPAPRGRPSRPLPPTNGARLPPPPSPPARLRGPSRTDTTSTVRSPGTSPPTPSTCTQSRPSAKAVARNRRARR